MSVLVEIPDLATDAPELLRAEAVTKNFGPTTVLRGLGLTLRRGEVLALVGDNGAGKSTFIKILSGFHQPSSGRLFWEGAPIELQSPTEARERGIETVYQDLALVNDLSVAQNMYLGREPIKRVFGLPLDRRCVHARADARMRSTASASGFHRSTVSCAISRAASGNRSRSHARCFRIRSC